MIFCKRYQGSRHGFTGKRENGFKKFYSDNPSYVVGLVALLGDFLCLKWENLECQPPEKGVGNKTLLARVTVTCTRWRKSFYGYFNHQFALCDCNHQTQSCLRHHTYVPPEILFSILDYLSFRALLPLRIVSKTFLHLITPRIFFKITIKLVIVG